MKKIKLTQRQYAIVDDADYEELSKYKWHAHRRKTGIFYALRWSARKKGKRHLIQMSREILGLKKGDPRQADHVNHITLDNRRDNIRICTNQQNQQNQKPSLNTTSQYKGVYWCKQKKRWHARIKINRESKYLGLFTKEKYAAQAYNLAAKRHFGEFALLNKI